MKYIKPLTAAILSGLTAYFHVIAVPVALLFVVMLLDYMSGVANAYTKGEWSSKVGLRGIIKKVCYMGVVIVAAVFDWIIYSGLAHIGVGFDNSYYFGLIVTIWLIINECISILENLGELGVPMPGFLLKGIKKLQKQIDDKGGNDDE